MWLHLLWFLLRHSCYNGLVVLTTKRHFKDVIRQPISNLTDDDYCLPSRSRYGDLLQTGRSRVPTSVGARNVSPSHTLPERPCVLLSFLYSEYRGGPLPGVKRAGRGVDQPPRSRAEVKNE